VEDPLCPLQPKGLFKERRIEKFGVFYHDKCSRWGVFGCPVFTLLPRAHSRDATFVFSGLLHRAGALFDEKQSMPIENAIRGLQVFQARPRLTWWFDTTRAALPPLRRIAAHFEQDQSNRKFYDPDFKSCTGLSLPSPSRRFGFNPAPVANLGVLDRTWSMAPCIPMRKPQWK